MKKHGRSRNTLLKSCKNVNNNIKQNAKRNILSKISRKCFSYAQSLSHCFSSKLSFKSSEILTNGESTSPGRTTT